jgi:hypothetical protein
MPRGIRKNGSKYAGKFFVGQKFGFWEVADPTIKQVNSQGGASVLVKCECGTTSHISCLRLVKGESKGCPCRIVGKNSFHWKGTENISGKYLNSIKKAAEKRGKIWNLSDDYLEELIKKQSFKCSLSGLPIEFSYKQSNQTASLDRIDSSDDYVEGNVQWVHKNVNVMKHTFAEEEFINLCGIIYDYNRDRRKQTEVSDKGRTRLLFSSK